MDKVDYIVVECCQNCSEHKWNTRHNEGKYKDFFLKRKSKLNEVKAMVDIVSPGTQVLMNQVPKTYAVHDLYFNLVANDD